MQSRSRQCVEDEAENERGEEFVADRCDRFEIETEGRERVGEVMRSLSKREGRVKSVSRRDSRT